jgi:hypothetical protein
MNAPHNEETLEATLVSVVNKCFVLMETRSRIRCRVKRGRSWVTLLFFLKLKFLSFNEPSSVLHELIRGERAVPDCTIMRKVEATCLCAAVWRSPLPVSGLLY